MLTPSLRSVVSGTRIQSGLMIVVAAIMLTLHGWAMAVETAEKPHNAAAQPDIYTIMQRSNQSIGDAVISPTMQRFIDSSALLLSASREVQSTPSSENMSLFKDRLLTALHDREMLRAFEFGPVHSLGISTQLDTPTDQDAVLALLESDKSFMKATTNSDQLVSSLQGFSAIEFLLNHWQSEEESIDFNTRQRLYLVRLSQKIHQMALNTKQVWFDSFQGYPAYNDVLLTAGQSGNTSYTTVESATEELTRASLNTLGVLLEEQLPELIESAQSLVADDDWASVMQLRGSVAGVYASYSGLPDVYAWGNGVAFAAQEVAENKVNAQSQALPVGRLEPGSGVGLSSWVSSHDPDLDAILKEHLKDATDTVDDMLSSNTVNSEVVAAQLENLVVTVSSIHQTLEKDVLPLTRR